MRKNFRTRTDQNSNLYNKLYLNKPKSNIHFDENNKKLFLLFKTFF